MLQVWQENLDVEMALIRDIIDDYPYLAMGKGPDLTESSTYGRLTLHALSLLPLQTRSFLALLLDQSGVSSPRNSTTKHSGMSPLYVLTYADSLQRLCNQIFLGIRIRSGS